MPLSRKALPFDDPEWIFELKYDGFRALAIIENGRCQLVSRNGHPFNSFSDLRQGISSSAFNGKKIVIDGEIVCLDDAGTPQFRDLLFHRAERCFYAFDLLMCDGRDLRPERLIDRKRELRRLMSTLTASAPLRYADHLAHHGTALFQRVCEMDLEGIVAKHSFGPTSLNRNERPGSKSRIVAIPRSEDVKNYLSADATKNRLLAGIAVN